MTTAVQTNSRTSRFDDACDMVAALRSGITDDATRDTLLRFDGWGPVADLFSAGKPGATRSSTAERAAAQLVDLAGEAHTGAADAVDTSFFTPRPLVEAVWGALVAAGIDGGRVVDLGCGTGRFGVWAPPGNWEYVGVERDAITADAARLLLPAATIITGDLADVALPGRFDAAVGNIPFSDTRIYSHGESDRLDNTFVKRAVDALRPGGVAVLITPASWVDHCEVNDLDAALVTAVRLPAGAFPGTQAIGDVVVLRRGTTGRRLIGRVELAPQTAHFTPRVATWWRDNPEMVAGTLRAGTHTRRPVEIVTDDRETDTARVLDLLVQAASGCAGRPDSQPFGDGDVLDAQIPAGTFLRDGDGNVTQAGPDGTAAPVKASRELMSLLDLRDAVKLLLAAEVDTALDDAVIAPVRRRALDLYTAYVAKYGPLNRGTLHEGAVDSETGLPKLSWRRPRLGGFRADPDWTTVMAVERYDQHTGAAEPAPILTRRVNRPAKPVTSCETAAEAIAISCGEGQLDMRRVQGLLGLADQAETFAALTGLVFRDPATGDVVPAGEYLSGNIRAKMGAARAAAAVDGTGRWAANIAALEQALPSQLAPGGFTCQLGSPLLTEADVQAFVTGPLGARRCSVQRAVGVGTWEVEAGGCDQTFTVGGRDGGWLVQQLLNRRTPKITVYDPTVRRDVVDRELTSAAHQQAKRIAELFTEWVWTDGERADRITAEYNRIFRSHRARTFDGGQLTFPGMDPVIRDNLWPWQRAMVHRMVSTPAVLCGHAPGGGKTLTMVAGAATLRQFGLARKPMIVVPNHLLDQIAREAQQAYPLGRYLVAGSEDLRGAGRAAFLARCATGDWDAVIITHSAFTSIPVPADVERTWVADQVAALRDSLRDGNGNYFAAKEIARRVRSLEAQLDRLRDTSTTGTVTFDQLGVDYLAIDEAHLMKGLPIVTRTTGLTAAASKRATDLLMKATLLRWAHPDRPVLGLFTGTPWLNSLSETFVWQQFCQPGRLAEAGIDQFDTWAAMFVQQESRVEMRPDGGGLRIKTRPTKLLNVPELRAMLGDVADVLPEDAMGADRPTVDARIHTVPMNDAQQAKVAELVERAGNLSADTKHEDNMLVICSEGRRVALDPALLGLPGGAPKIDVAARTIAGIWANSRGDTYPDSDVPGSLQIVFADQGTPKPGDGQTYGRLRNRLIELGVPAGRIRWVHEATDDKSRAALFTACRAGEVSVLLGSTDKLGLGTNVQTRAVAVHHLDAPWRPADVMQRDARAVRPGNLNPAVQVHRYVTERSFDALMWETLERKAGFVQAFFRANDDVRTVDDITDVALSFGEVKAAAAGNPAIYRLYEAQQSVSQLRIMRAVESRAMTAARKAAAFAEDDAKRREARAEALDDLDDAGWAPWAWSAADMAAQIRNTARYWARRAEATTPNGVRFVVEVEHDKSVAVRADVDYRRVLEFRCGSFRAAAERIDDWWDTVGRNPAAEAARLRGAAADLRAEAARQSHTADTWRFSRASDLAAAEVELDSLQTSLADTAIAA